MGGWGGGAANRGRVGCRRRRRREQPRRRPGLRPCFDWSEISCADRGKLRRDAGCGATTEEEGAQDTQDVARIRTNAGCAAPRRAAAVGARPPALVTLSSLHRSRQPSSGRTTTRLAVPQPPKRPLGERAEAAIGSSRHSKGRLSSRHSKRRLFSLKEAALVTQRGSSRLSSLKEAALVGGSARDFLLLFPKSPC